MSLALTPSQLAGSIGAFLIGALASIFLLGINVSQSWYYYRSFPKDARSYKALVAICLALDWNHTIIACALVYNWTVTNYGNESVLLVSPWSFSIDPAITGMMGWLVQCFYAYRIYILSKRRILIPAIVFVLASVSLGFAIGSTYHAFTQRYFASFDQWAWGVYVWLGTAVGADLVLTGALVYYLRQNKSGTDESDENHNGLIEIIVRVTIENNLATGVTSIIHAGLFASMESNYHVIFNYILVKLYFSSLLVSLNSRAALRQKLNDRLPLPASANSFSAGMYEEKRPAYANMTRTKSGMSTDRFDRKDYEEFSSRENSSGVELQRLDDLAYPASLISFPPVQRTLSPYLVRTP